MSTIMEYGSSLQNDDDNDNDNDNNNNNNNNNDGLTNGFTRVFRIDSGELIAELDCKGAVSGAHEQINLWSN